MSNSDDYQYVSQDLTGDDASPVGFCPHCDYPLVAGGICSECGNHVIASELNRIPNKLWRRMVIRRIAIIAAGLAVLITAWQIVDTGVWKNWVSTDYLISMQPQNDWSTEELFARIATGSLTQKQLVAYLDRAFLIQLDVRSPRPIDCTLRLSLYTGTESGPTNVRRHSIDIAVSTVCIADEFELEGGGWSTFVHRNNEFLYHNIDLDADIGPQLHEIKVEGTISVALRSSTGVVFPGFPIVRPFTAVQSVEFQDRPLTDFVHTVYSDELARGFQENTTATVCWGVEDKSTSLSVDIERPPANIASKFQLIREDLDQPVVEIAFATDASSGLGYSSIGGSTFHLNQLRAHEAQLVATPSLAEAFERGYDTIFGGRMIWSLPPIGDRRVAGQPLPLSTIPACRNGEPPFAQPPDRIEQWTPPDSVGDGSGHSAIKPPKGPKP